MALPEPLIGDSWTERMARRMVPLLVWCAQHGKKITYGQLDEEIQRRGWGHHVNVVVFGHPAGAVGDALVETEGEIGEKIPPLNALVVNSKTGIPGSGCDYYLATYLEARHRKKLTDDQRRSMAEETMEEVWRFQKWDEILELYGLRPIKGDIPNLRTETEVNKPKRGGWSNEPESREHKALKDWVSRNPSILRSKVNFEEGHVERVFPSADCVDVLFSHDLGSVAVEVKSSISNDADLERGIYQCVKYQALLRAELKAEGNIPNGSAVLVSERSLPIKLRNLADLLGVRVITIDQERLTSH